MSTPTTSKTNTDKKKSVYGACRAVDQFEKLNRIGEGTYGTVYRARNKETDEIVALKRVILHNEKQDGFPVTSIREIRLLNRVSHPNIVDLKEVVVGRRRESVFLVFEYCEHDMANLLDNVSHPFSESEIKSLVRQLLSAVAYLHSEFVIHRDLKMSNLLYTRRGKLKLADFGLARLFSEPHEKYTPKVVTLWYRPPELLLGGTRYTTAVDMWGVGCIFGELLLRAPLMPGNCEMDQLTRTFKLLGVPNDKIWPGFSRFPHAKAASSMASAYRYNNLRARFPDLSSNGLDLLNSLLTYDPARRMTAQQALEHPYFKQAPLPKDPGLMPTFPTLHTHAAAAAAQAQGQGGAAASAGSTTASSSAGGGGGGIGIGNLGASGGGGGGGIGGMGSSISRSRRRRRVGGSASGGSKRDLSSVVGSSGKPAAAAVAGLLAKRARMDGRIANASF